MTNPNFGKFNDYPPNWKPCDTSEFWSHFFCYSWEREEYRQMMRPDKVHATMFPAGTPSHSRPALTARLFFYSDDTGLAMVQTYENGKFGLELYKFALCEHDMVRVREKSSMCYTVSRCTKCGMERGVDSSG